MRIALSTAAAALLLLGGSGASAQAARGAPPPNGGYWSTCRNVTTYCYGEDQTMTAQCRDDRGQWRDTSLRVGRCGQVENRDGQLVCFDNGGGRPDDQNGWRPGEQGGWRPGEQGGWRPGDQGGYRPGGRRGSLTLYSGPDFTGPAYETRSEITNLPKAYNDRALSLRIEGRGAWTVCSDSDFRGRCQTFDRDVRDLRRFGLGEAISSMRPAR